VPPSSISQESTPTSKRRRRKAYWRAPDDDSTRLGKTSLVVPGNVLHVTEPPTRSMRDTKGMAPVRMAEEAETRTGDPGSIENNYSITDDPFVFSNYIPG
jgi:hypothetical protein